MELADILKLAARFLHILSACIAIGVPIFQRFVLLDALSSLDETTRKNLSETIARRFAKFVHLAIVIFLATGFYTFLGVARWRGMEASAKFQYHLLVGVKILLALVLFFFASALVGRSKVFAFVRENARMYLMVMAGLGAVIVAVSAYIRFL